MPPLIQLPMTPHPYVAVAAGTTQIINGRGILMGWAIRMSAVGTFDLFDGPAANGLQIGTASLAAATSSDSVFFGDRGVYFDNGLFTVHVGGTATGAVYYIAETRLTEYLVDQESRAAAIGALSQGFPFTPPFEQ